MSWVKRVLYLIAGLLLSVALLVGGALLYLDDGHYRRLLVFGADHFLDASLKINGDFSFRLGKEITLAAEAVRLTAHDGSYSATIGEFSGKQRLGSYLMTGTFWINSLVLSDVQVDIKQTDESAFDLHGLSLPPVVIQEAQLHNLQLFYTRQKPAETHEISLLELIVDDINNSGPVQVNGAGLVDGRPLSIKGSLGALSELVDSRQPYPLNLDVASGELQLHLSGTIADLVRGEGLDLGLSFTDPNLSKTVQLFDKSAPEIGSVRAQAHLSGSYDAPRLDALKVHLERGEAVAVNITGTVGNLVTGAGLALQVDGKSSDPAVLSWLLYERADRVRSFRVKGKLHEDDGRFYATGVDANAITRTGIEVSISGNTQLPTRRDPHPGHAQQLVVKMYAPTVASLNLPEFGRIPEFGKVAGSANMTPYLDGLRYSNIRLEAGDSGQVHATVTGTIGLLPYELNKGITGIDLDVALTAKSSQALGAAIDYELPDLGAVQAAMQVSGTTDNLVFDGISLNTGDPDQPTIRANGTATTRLKSHSSVLKVTFEVATGDLVAALRNVTPDYLGRLEGSVEMSDIDGSWGLDSFHVASTQTKLYSVKISGALDDIVKRDTAKINIFIDVPDPPALGRAADLELGGIASFRTEGVIGFKNEWVTYDSTDQVGRSRSTTSLSGSMAGERPSLKGSTVIPVLYLEDIGLHPDAEPDTLKAVNKAPEPGQPEGRPHLFSREPLDFNILKRIDLDLDIKIDEIASTWVSADKLYGRILLENGRLQVRPMKLVAEGGPTDLDLVIDVRAMPVISMKLTADDQQLGRWLAQVQDQVPVDGFVNYDIVLDARGESTHELAAGLNGHVALALENVRIPARYVEYLSADVFGWVLGKVDEKDRYSDINCMLASFQINDGVAKSSLLAADGPHLALEGTMTLNLGEETIDAVILPKQKKRLFARIAPVRLTGDIRDPDVHAIPAKEAAMNIGALVLVPYVAIPVTILGRLWEAVDDKDKQGGGCAKLQAAKAAEGEKLKQPKEVESPAAGED